MAPLIVARRERRHRWTVVAAVLVGARARPGPCSTRPGCATCCCDRIPCRTRDTLAVSARSRCRTCPSSRPCSPPRPPCTPGSRPATARTRAVAPANHVRGRAERPRLGAARPDRGDRSRATRAGPVTAFDASTGPPRRHPDESVAGTSLTVTSAPDLAHAVRALGHIRLPSALHNCPARVSGVDGVSLYGWASGRSPSSGCRRTEPAGSGWKPWSVGFHTSSTVALRVGTAPLVLLALRVISRTGEGEARHLSLAP